MSRVVTKLNFDDIDVKVGDMPAVETITAAATGALEAELAKVDSQRDDDDSELCDIAQVDEMFRKELAEPPPVNLIRPDPAGFVKPDSFHVPSPSPMSDDDHDANGDHGDQTPEVDAKDPYETPSNPRSASILPPPIAAAAAKRSSVDAELRDHKALGYGSTSDSNDEDTDDSPPPPPNKKRKSNKVTVDRDLLESLLKRVADVVQDKACTAADSKAPTASATTTDGAPIADTAAVSDQPKTVEFYQEWTHAEAPEHFEEWCLDEIDRITSETERKLANPRKMRLTTPEAERIRLEESISKLKQRMGKPEEIEKHYQTECVGWMHPDTTLKLADERLGGNLWWEKIKVSQLSLGLTSVPYNKLKKSPAISYSLPQNFMGVPLKGGAIMTPVMEVKWPKMYPHGNKDARECAPDHVYDMQAKLHLINTSVSNRFVPEEVSFQPNAERFLTWLNGVYAQEMSGLVYDKGAGIAEGPRATAEGIAKEQARSVSMTDEERAVRQKAAFLASCFKPPAPHDKQTNKPSIATGTPLVYRVFPKDQEKFYRNVLSGSQLPYRPRTQWFSHLFFDKILRVITNAEMKKRKEERSTFVPSKFYEPMIEHDIPMYRARTVAEELEILERTGKPSQYPWEPVAYYDRDIQPGDLVSCVLTPKLFSENSTKEKTGFGEWRIHAIIWIGKSGLLEEAKQVPKSFDLSTAFVSCGRYKRTRPALEADQMVPSDEQVKECNNRWNERMALEFKTEQTAVETE